MNSRLLVCIFVCFLVAGVSTAFGAVEGLNGRIVASVFGRGDVSVVDPRPGGAIEQVVLSTDSMYTVGSFSQTGRLYSLLLNQNSGAKYFGSFDFSSPWMLSMIRASSPPVEMAVSPDGTKMAYLVDSSPRAAGHDPNARVVIKDLITGAEHDEGLDNVEEVGLSWSVRNQLAYKHLNDGRIYVKEIGVPGERPISDDTIKEDHHFPDWSPNGSRLIYTSRTRVARKLVVVNADGSNPQDVTSLSEDAYGGVFSPDGEKIAYLRSISGQPQIFIRDAKPAQTAASVEQITQSLPTGLMLATLAWQPRPHPSRHTPGNGGVGSTPALSSTRSLSGGANRPGMAVRDRHTPAITNLKLSRKALSPTLKGGSVEFSLTQSAAITITIRKGKRKLTVIRKRGKQGKNQIALTGKHKLHPGRYQLVISVKDSRGNQSEPRTQTFVVKKR